MSIQRIFFSIIAALVFTQSAMHTISAQERRRLDVYMVAGKGAEGVLTYPLFRTLFTKTIFRDHDVNIDIERNKDYFLKNTFESDIVYYSLHSNPHKLCIASGEMVTPEDILAAKPDDTKNPKLIIVTGCETLRDEDRMSFPDAFGISNASKDKRAYIGFKTLTPGSFCDHYFRAFFALWLEPKTDGKYRTLVEAKTDAKARLIHILDLKGMGKKNEGSGTRSQNIDNKTMPENEPGDPSSVGQLDPDVADWFTIIGDPDLTLMDLYEKQN